MFQQALALPRALLFGGPTAEPAHPSTARMTEIATAENRVCFPTRWAYINRGTEIGSPDDLDLDVTSDDNSSWDASRVCVPAFGFEDSGGREIFSGAINILSSLHEFWWELSEARGGAVNDELARAFSGVLGRPLFEVEFNYNLNNKLCSRPANYSVDLTVFDIEEKAIAAGLDPSVLSDSGLFELYRRDDFAERYRGRGNTCDTAAPSSWETAPEGYFESTALAGHGLYQLTPEAVPSAQGWAPLGYEHDLSDYAARLAPTWPMRAGVEGTHAAFVGADRALGPEGAHGVHLLMLGNDVAAWLSLGQIENSIYPAPKPRTIFSCVSGPPRKITRFYFEGARLAALARTAVERDPGDCRYPDVNSLGLPHDLIPPLENEVTYDSNPGESAYLTYVGAAEEAASNAATLLQAAVEEEHAMAVDHERYLASVDVTVADAEARVAQLCGGATVGITDPAAVGNACLPN